MKKLFFLLSCLLVLGSAPVWAQTSEPPMIVVRVTEDTDLVRLVIERGTGKQEELEFRSGYTRKDNQVAAKGYFDFLNKLYQQGYILQASIVGVPSQISNSTTLVFVKPSKP
ncbi:hypothetical protein [Hymenobacter metallicola]|uniref:POTRA domain-containing protein n=1 Tax=Hymenobacter metallicola TaxID=2563114 RepID=A0A4Z0QI16_9BACT|nr:hypothetical protein [Hymenobacter metallicola]TGE29717.1 hypothetical protein E5K02_09740 [Hymenobacter metallicola]